jgi:hypothetical protein
MCISRIGVVTGFDITVDRRIVALGLCLANFLGERRV